MRRTVWDGNHELWEIQAPGHDNLAAYWENDTTRLNLTVNPGAYYDINRNLGRVGYTHAGTVDQPLSLTRFAYSDVDIYNFSLQAYPPFTIVPMWNWRGHAEWGAFADSGTAMDGAGRRCTSLQATRCVVPRWFAGGTAFMGMTPTPPSDTGLFADAWIGTLVSGKDDGTGTLYRRNRYLDPSTGRFTQEDPIGLAGGLNLYGFAGGDPVTFSDPFGLCPENNLQCELLRAAAQITGGILGSIGGFAIGAAAGAETGPGVAVTSVAGAISFGASTAIASGQLVDMAFAMSEGGSGSVGGGGSGGGGGEIRNVRTIQTGRLRGYTRGNGPDREGGVDGARSLFRQLTGRDPTGSMDRGVSDALEVVFRQGSRSGPPKIEVVDHNARTLIKYAFPE